MTSRRLAVGSAEVTAVLDVVANFPDPLGEAFPAVEAAAWCFVVREVDRPDWGPGSDAQPETARATRRHLLDRLETEAMWLAPSHFPDPFGTITRDQDGRHWTGHRRRIMP